MAVKSKAWVKPALLELDVEKTLVATVTGSLEVLTTTPAGSFLDGRCCS